MHKYIGIPYSDLNCAELVALYLENELGKKATAEILRGFPEHTENSIRRSIAISSKANTLTDKITGPENNAGVILRYAGRLSHMGIVVELPSGFYILHTMDKFGSVLEPIDSLSGCSIEGFYRWK